MRLPALRVLSALALAGCSSGALTPDAGTPDAGGGGDAGSTDGGSPRRVGDEGLYFGSVTGSDDSVAVLLTGSGGYWVWHYNDAGLYGGAVGMGFTDGGVFVAAQVEVTNDPGSLQATLADGRFDGSLSYADGSINPTVAFTTTSDPGYDAPASLGAVVGSWSTPVITDTGGFGLETQTLTIAASGSLTADNPLGCDAVGTISPDSSNKNYFDLSVTYQGGDCIFGTSTLTGVAVVDTPQSQPQLLTSIILADGTDGIVSCGRRMPASPQ